MLTYRTPEAFAVMDRAHAALAPFHTATPSPNPSGFTVEADAADGSAVRVAHSGDLDYQDRARMHHVYADTLRRMGFTVAVSKDGVTACPPAADSRWHVEWTYQDGVDADVNVFESSETYDHEHALSRVATLAADGAENLKLNPATPEAERFPRFAVEIVEHEGAPALQITLPIPLADQLADAAHEAGFPAGDGDMAATEFYYQLRTWICRQKLRARTKES